MRVLSETDRRNINRQKDALIKLRIENKNI